jgi:hypothetical protein
VRARMPVEPAMALMQSMLKAQLLYGKEEDDEE